MKANKLQSLNRLFLRLFWIHFLFPILALTFLAIGITAYLGGQAFEIQQFNLNRAVAYTASNYLIATKQSLESLVGYGESSSLKDLVLAIDIKQKGNQNFDAFYLLGNNGRVLATSPRDNRYMDMDFSGQPYFKSALESNEVVSSRPFISMTTGYPAVFLATQVGNRWVLVGELSLKEIQSIISGQNLSWQSTTFVTDQYGTLLAHPDFDRVLQQENVKAVEILNDANQGSGMHFRMEQDNLYLIQASQIQPDEWIIVTQTPATEIYRPYYSAALLLVPSFLIVLLLFIRQLFWQFNRLVLSPVTQLSRFTENIAAGEYIDRKNDIQTIPVTFRELAILISNFNGMSQSVQSRERQLAFMANHDFLTRLPNRQLFQKTLVEKIKQVTNTEESFALLFIDLDNFKTINDAFGHQIGDQTLLIVTQLLEEIAPCNAFLGRLGGDEFAILLPDMRYARDAMELCERLIGRFNQPFQFGNNQVYLSASIGISFYPEDGLESDTLIQNADTAMYSAKQEGKNGYQFYNLQIKTQAQERHMLSAHLHHALELNEFSLVYHPIYSACDQKLTGCEALARWKNPRLGQVSPDRFIALANETGLILPIGEWILRTACLQARHWLDLGRAICVNVNVAERQLKHKNFPEKVAKILEETGLPPELLTLELTENIFFQNYKDKELDIVVSQIKRLGITLALDDFGTGYSTLSCLTQIPFDEIKIDRSLSINAIASPRDAAIVKGILNMAHDLGMKVVAEGIENTEQRAFYLALHCDKLQGYYFSHPLTGEEMTQLLS